MTVQAVGAPAELGAAVPAASPASPPRASTGAGGAAAGSAGRDLRRALDALAGRLDPSRTELSFRVDERAHQVVISIVDPNSGAVLRQIPAEEVLRMAQNLQEWLGALVDEQA